jgi:hypothetical protein
MQPPAINWIAVLLATVSAFVVGGLWYSPILFAKPWMALTGATEQKMKNANMGLIYGTTFVLAAIAATNLAFFVGQESASMAAFYGFAAGAGWVATSYGTTYLFEQKPFKLWAINAGYHVVTLTLMGLIIGLM